MTPNMFSEYVTTTLALVLRVAITVVVRVTTPNRLQLLWFCASRLQIAYNYCGCARHDSKTLTITVVLRDTTPKLLTITVVLRGTTPKRLQFLVFLNGTIRFLVISLILQRLI